MNIERYIIRRYSFFIYAIFPKNLWYDPSFRWWLLRPFKTREKSGNGKNSWEKSVRETSRILSIIPPYSRKCVLWVFWVLFLKCRVEESPITGSFWIFGALSHRAVRGLYCWRLNHKMPGVMTRSNWRGGDLWTLTSLSSLHSRFDFFQRFVNGTNSWEKNNERSNSHYFIRLIMRITTIYSDNQ